jgi:hypothetical protein
LHFISESKNIECICLITWSLQNPTTIPSTGNLNSLQQGKCECECECEKTERSCSLTLELENGKVSVSARKKRQRELQRANLEPKIDFGFYKV